MRHPVTPSIVSNTREIKNMMNSARHVVEILFQGISREIKLPAPVTVVGLREAIVSTFDIAKIMSAENSVPMSNSGNRLTSPLKLTYRDADEQEVTLGEDSELALALRQTLDPLRVTASLLRTWYPQFLYRPESSCASDDPLDGTTRRLYQTAVFNLRIRGVPSIKTSDLEKTMALLRLCPRRLIVRGLALPRTLHGETTAMACTPTRCSTDGVVCSPLNSDSAKMEKGYGKWSKVGATKNSQGGSTQADGRNGDEAPAKDKLPRRSIETAMLEALVGVRPREIKAFLRALGVTSRRLDRLGFIGGETLDSEGDAQTSKPGYSSSRQSRGSFRGTHADHTAPRSSSPLLRASWHKGATVPIDSSSASKDLATSISRHTDGHVDTPLDLAHRWVSGGAMYLSVTPASLSAPSHGSHHRTLSSGEETSPSAGGVSSDKALEEIMSRSHYGRFGGKFVQGHPDQLSISGPPFSTTFHGSLGQSALGVDVANKSWISRSGRCVSTAALDNRVFGARHHGFSSALDANFKSNISRGSSDWEPTVFRHQEYLAVSC